MSAWWKERKGKGKRDSGLPARLLLFPASQDIYRAALANPLLLLATPSSLPPDCPAAVMAPPSLRSPFSEGEASFLTCTPSCWSVAAQEIFEVGSEGMSVTDLAARLAVSPGELLKALFMKVGLLIALHRTGQSCPALLSFDWMPTEGASHKAQSNELCEAGQAKPPRKHYFLSFNGCGTVACGASSCAAL